MRGWISRSLLICGIFSLVWIAVVYTWRANNRMPNGAEVALYFFALPIAILIAIWLLVKAWSFATTPTTTTESDAAKIAAAEITRVDEHVAANERSLSIGVLVTAIRNAHGSSAEELTSNLKENEARLDLDPELQNRDGFPVLTGRISEIDEDAQRETLSSWSQLTGRENQDWNAEQLRAISIGSEVAIELAQQVVKHPLLEPYISAIARNREVPALPMLQLIIVLPERWRVEQRHFLSDWFFDLIRQQGWPAEKISFRSVHPSSSNNALLAIDHLMLDSFRLSQPCFGLVIACDSHIGEATIQEWEDAGKLFFGKNGDAQMPGEGAAGILIGDETQAKLMALETNARLHRIVQNRRSKSIDVRGNAGDSILEPMIQDALAMSKIQANDISLISSDADQRGNRIVELMSVGFKLFPDLDPTSQYFKLTSNCGDMGAVASLAALILGHFQVVNETKAALCISNIDSLERTVALLSPWVDAQPDSVTNT